MNHFEIQNTEHILLDITIYIWEVYKHKSDVILFFTIAVGVIFVVLEVQ